VSEATREGRLALRNESLDWRLVDGEIVALDLSNNTYFATNASGALIWSRLHDGATRMELVELLCMRYGLTTDDAERAVDAFTEQLAEKGLLA
jgi:coenzyme PQQ synthesis protein D (PqqD)